jgi:plasmid stabilization system protein ParE
MLKWTPKSESDLLEIQEHIAKNFNVDLAMETVLEIVDHCEKLLTSNPLAGKILESNPLFSKLVHKGNSIYYCENPKDKNLYVVYVQARGTRKDLSRINSQEVA